MAEPFVGQIISVGFSFAPVGWLACDGTNVPISEYTVLYNLLGTIYGGDGVTTFGLPNLNGRVPLGQGQGQGLSPYVQGQLVGTEGVTLTAGSMPGHTHALSFSNLAASLESPKPVSGANVAMGSNVNLNLPGGFYVSGKAGTVALKPDTITPVGSSLPHENRQQFLALNYIIAYAGIYPSQG
ncbi:MAG TPA: tail fiber protein [Reyranella sp.]|jgi:microcystin-dependent protein